MNILVTKNNVQIDTREELNKGEYNVNKLYFTFTQDYDGLTKMAVFSNLLNNYELAITNNMCNIPPQILEARGCFTLGVYAYTIENEEIVIRYSPEPIELKVDDGSYIRALNPQMTEPTLFQTFAQQIEEQFDNVTDAIGDNTDEINDLKDRATALEDGKQDNLTAGSHITINNNVISSDGEPNVITKIQKNGSDLPINNKIVNVPIPTTTNELTNNSGFITKEVNNLTNYLLKVSTGATLEATINNTTYVMTLKLKNSSGTALSTQTIDLPLETMVINASYDSATKEIVLYLKNGNTVRFSVADLISGLQEEITPSNKLSSDLVDDTNHTNKFVTQAEKTKLAGIETGAEVNVIEEVKVNNEALAVENKSVNIDLTGIETDIETLQTENAELLDQIPKDTVEGKVIHLEDSSNLSFKDVEMLGEASQDTSILYYKCVGTETGDYYFVYDSTNYQFTMPTITANELLTFDTTTLKLYQGTTEITTTTDNTGTLITLSATPSPDYEVPVKVVTGDNEVKITGKNLFNINDTIYTRYSTYSISGNTISVTGTSSNSNGRIWWNIPILKNETVTFSRLSYAQSEESVNNKIEYILSDIPITSYTDLTSSTIISKTSTSTTINATKKYLVLILRVSNSSYTCTATNIQVEVGSNATTYEAYTEQSQQIFLGVTNLFDKETVTYKNKYYIDTDGTEKASDFMGYTTSFTPVRPNTTYTLSGTLTVNSYSSVYFYDNNSTFISKLSSGGNVRTFTTPANCTKIQFQYRASTIDFDTVQIEEGSTVNPYSPYGQTPIELCKIGDYKDRIYKANGKWWLEKNIGKIASYNGETITTAYISTTGGLDTGATVYYVLATPVTPTEITDTTLIGQLENWLKMKTNRNITNIYTDTDNEVPTLTVEYRQDITTLIDDLTNAIVSLGNNT